MLDSLYIGASGMQAQQQNVDAISNNLANVNTSGYKRSRIDFEDLLYRASPATRPDTSQSSGTGRMGMGTAVAGSSKVFTVGDVKKTSEPLDLAINGQGFFEIALPDGSVGYTRNGAFRLDKDGMLVNQDGYALVGSINVPSDATQVRIESTGRVTATLVGQREPVEIGQIHLANFTNPAGLTAMGDNLYLANERAGEPIVGNPGENGTGTLAQGFLEGSNVRLIDEMVALILAQRAYEINAKVVQASDELLSISNNLYR
jgi:flagellar basal-body rod protein FlgG